MLKSVKIFNWILCIALAGLGALFWLYPQSTATLMPEPPQGALPKNAFAQAEKAYVLIGEGALAVSEPQIKLGLPDLRSLLVYQGKNGRPDIHPSSTSLYLGLKDGPMRQAQIGERIYLSYQGGVGTYQFSPTPTPLWIIVRPTKEDTLGIEVGMTDPSGNVVTSPEENRRFELAAIGVPSKPSTGWNLGGLRVDTTLLVRQRARWVGEDLFLARHGGDEYAYTIDRQRVDFMRGDQPYSCFVREGDFLSWQDERWHVTRENTLGQPLLVVTKVDNKVISFDLWNPEGSGKLTLSLIRTKEGGGLPDVAGEFQFVGAKSWAQFIVECRGNRMVLHSGDWLVLTKDGWHNLATPQEIDDYVNQKLTGPLFVLERMRKTQGKQVLAGRLYNALRTEEKEVELSAGPLTPLAAGNFDFHETQGDGEFE